MKQPRHCQVPDCAACEALDRYGVQEPRDESFFPVTQANPVARCIEIIREVRDGFLSEEYAVGQPLPSLPERFACDQAIAAIEEWFAASAGRNAERHDNADWRGRNDEHAVGSEADETPTPSPPVQDDDALRDALEYLRARITGGLGVGEPQLKIIDAALEVGKQSLDR